MNPQDWKNSCFRNDKKDFIELQKKEEFESYYKNIDLHLRNKFVNILEI